MTVQVADAHVHSQRLVSVAKMTMLEEYSTEEQNFTIIFCGQKD
jgi:hypothetical protein